VEIADCCLTALDESYRSYASFVVKTYGIEPEPMSLWIRVNRGISNRSRSTTGLRLVSGVEHRRRQAERLRALAWALAAH
jgi:hypothetical protein